MVTCRKKTVNIIWFRLENTIFKRNLRDLKKKNRGRGDGGGGCCFQERIIFQRQGRADNFFNSMYLINEISRVNRKRKNIFTDSPGSP